jgi:phosphoribosylamine--glycine ligase
MGDPETQPIMARIKSDLTEVFEHAIAGTLDRAEIEWDRRTALGVVLAASGYPDDPRTGEVITGVGPRASVADDCFVFHAGTTFADGTLKTAGGRVLCVTGLGDSVKIAQARAYSVIDGIHFDGMQYRRDIGHRALSRRPGAPKRG